MDGRPWSDLPADVLREISVRVRAAADFVSFHAVCKPWRSSRDLLSRRRTITTQLLPWLVAPAVKESSAHLKFRCVFSKASYFARLPGSSTHRIRYWVCNADGTAVRYLTIENLRPSLHDPLNGDVTRLPLLPDHFGQWEKMYPHCVVYGDGSTFLYKIFRGVGMTKFQAALLSPGDTEWTAIIERTFQTSRCGEYYAAYHGGKFMVTAEACLWHVITPNNVHVAPGDVLVPEPLLTPHWEQKHQFNYLMESRGELLWALVQVENYDYYRSSRSRRGAAAGVRHNLLSLSVHALKEEDSGSKKTMRWVRKDGHSLADRVLFLGWPNSFVMDVSRLSGHDAGCAYFVYSGMNDLPCDQVGVFRFNLVSNEAEFIERLPPGWNKGRCTWLIPQPTIAPIQEPSQRRLIAHELNDRQAELMAPIATPTFNIYLKRHYEPSFRVLVRNLTLTVTSSQLEKFLSMHGKVSKAEVLYYEKTKCLWGIVLTMSTTHAHVEDALEALNALILDGRYLEVSLVKEVSTIEDISHGRSITRYIDGSSEP